MISKRGWLGARGPEKLALAAVIAVAAFVRLSQSDLTWFVHDQARDSYTARSIVSGQSFPLLGPEVEGSPAHTWGPLYFYLVAIPFALSEDPAVAAMFLSFLSVIAVLLLYQLGRSFFGARVGVVAAALLATCPIIVITSRALSNSSVVLLFVIAFFYALLALVVHARSVMVIPLSLALAALIQLHLSTLSLVPVLVLAIAMFKPRVRLAHGIIALACSGLLMLPYAIAQARSDFQDLRALVSYGADQFKARGVRELGEMAGRVLFASPDAMDALQGIAASWRIGAFASLHRLESHLLQAGAVLLLAGAILGWRWRSGSPGAILGGRVLALWLVVPFLALAFKDRAQSHYFLVLYPGLFLALSLVLWEVVDRVGPVLPPRFRVFPLAVVYGLIALIVVSQLDFQQQFRRASMTAGAILWAQGDSRPVLELMPIHYKARLVRALTESLNADREAFSHRVHGSRFGDILEDEGYFFRWIAGTGPMPAAVSSASRGTGRSAPHYALVRDELSDVEITGRRVVPVGPYTLVEYVPSIDPDGWSCRGSAGAAILDRRPAQKGSRLVDPGNAIEAGRATRGERPYREWPALPAYCQGRMKTEPVGPTATHVVVSLRMPVSSDHEISDFRADGTERQPQRVTTHATFAAQSKDYVFGVSDVRSEGEWAIAFRISGEGRQFDVDVYEVRQRVP